MQWKGITSIRGVSILDLLTLQTKDAKELVRLLGFLAEAKGADKCSVITADPDLWLEGVVLPRNRLDILDISPALGPPSEDALPNYVVRELEQAGWPYDSIVREYRLSSKIGAVADVALVDGKKEPIALVELVSPHRTMEPSVNQVKRYAQLTAARYSIVTNGKSILLVDAATGSVSERTTFPSPLELGRTEMEAEKLRDLLGVQHEEDWGFYVKPFRHLENLVDELNSTRTEALIIDHTMPLVRQEKSKSVPQGIRLPHEIWFVANLLFAATLVASLRVLVAVVPRAFCSSPLDRPIRQYLQERFGLSAVIELSGLSQGLQYTTLRLTVKSTERVIFASVSSDELIDVESQPWVRDLRLALNGSTQTRYVFQTSAIRPNQDWTILNFQNQTEVILKRLRSLGNVANLGDVCQVIQGMRHSRESRSTGTPFVRGRDLAKHPLRLEDLDRFPAQNVPDLSRIRRGDILLQRIGAKPHVLVAEDKLESAVASDTVFILRPMQLRVDPFALAEFLQSPEGQKLLLGASRGMAAPTLTMSALRSLPVLLMPASVAKATGDLAEAERALVDNAQRLTSLRLSLFGSESPEVLSTRLADMRQKSKVISASLQEAESFEFQIRNFFPYPLAFVYRSLKSISDANDLYVEQLRLAENILAFIGSIILALVERDDRSDFDIVTTWQSGILPGAWRSIAEKGAKVLAQYKDHPLAFDLATLWTGPSRLPETLSKLIALKTDFKHNRGPKIKEEYSAAADATSPLLDICMQNLAFFTEYPIRMVTDINAIRGSRNVYLRTHRLTGDHPALLQETLEYPEPLPKGDLFVEVEEKRWASLFPFISAHTCPNCRTREFYFVDKWRGHGKPAQLLSFERGHTEEKLDVGEALTTWRS